jgi:hypothetical protein
MLRSVSRLVFAMTITFAGGSVALAQDPDYGEEPPVEETTPPEGEGMPGEEGMTEEGMTEEGMTEDTTTEAAPGMAAENYDKAGWPLEWVLRSVTYPAGMIEIQVPLVINLSKDSVGKPVSLPLGIWYGVNNDLSLGLTHSNPLLGGLGSGLCFTGEENGCPKFYDNIGVEALYRFLRGNFDLAAHIAVPISSFDPFLVGLALGVKGRVVLAGGKLGIFFDPSIYIGFTERDTAGNKEILAIPVDVAFQATPALAVGLGTRLAGPLDGFGDFHLGSLDLFGVYAVNGMIDAFLRFSFANLYGTDGGADARVLTIGANIRI